MWPYRVDVTSCGSAKTWWWYSYLRRHAKSKWSHRKREAPHSYHRRSSSRPEWFNCVQQVRPALGIPPNRAWWRIPPNYHVCDAQRPLQVQETNVRHYISPREVSEDCEWCSTRLWRSRKHCRWCDCTWMWNWAAWQEFASCSQSPQTVWTNPECKKVPVQTPEVDLLRTWSEQEWSCTQWRKGGSSSKCKASKKRGWSPIFPRSCTVLCQVPAKFRTGGWAYQEAD